jgi:hypothetical protein
MDVNLPSLRQTTGEMTRMLKQNASFAMNIRIGEMLH